MASGDDTGVPRAFAAKRLGVTPHTVSMWVQRGWVDRKGNHHTVRIVGKGIRGRLYRWGDLAQAESDTRNNINSARNPNRGDWTERDRNSNGGADQEACAA